MVRISRTVKKRLLVLLLDSLISAGALILTSRARSRLRWRSIKRGRGNMVKNAREIKTDINI
jgi:hypothetical protein